MRMAKQVRFAAYFECLFLCISIHAFIEEIHSGFCLGIGTWQELAMVSNVVVLLLLIFTMHKEHKLEIDLLLLVNRTPRRSALALTL